MSASGASPSGAVGVDSASDGQVRSGVVLLGSSMRWPEMANCDVEFRNLLNGVISSQSHTRWAEDHSTTRTAATDDVLVDSDDDDEADSHTAASAPASTKQHPLKAEDSAASTFSSASSCCDHSCDQHRIFLQSAAHLDPVERIILELCYEAIQASGDAATIQHQQQHSTREKGTPSPGLRVGVFVGAGHDEEDSSSEAAPTLDAAERVAQHFAFDGPSVNVTLQCPASLFALAQAMQALQEGRCDSAIVLAVAKRNMIAHLQASGPGSPSTIEGTSTTAASPTAVYIGAACVYLKVATRAREDGNRARAILRSFQVQTEKSCANGNLLLEVCTRAGVPPQNALYVENEAHVDRAPLADSHQQRECCELASAARAASSSEKSNLRVGSVTCKAEVDDPIFDCGLVSLIKLELSIRAQELFPSFNHASWTESLRACKEAQPLLAGGVRIQDEVEKWALVRPDLQPQHAALLLTGFCSAHTQRVVIVVTGPQNASEAPKEAENPHPRLVLPLSAVSQSSLALIVAQWRDWLSDVIDSQLSVEERTQECVRVAQSRLLQFAGARVCFVEPSASALLAALESWLASASSPSVALSTPTSARPIAFVFSGVGTAYPTLLAELYRRVPLVRALVRRCDLMLRKVASQTAATVATRAEAAKTDLPALLDDFSFICECTLFETKESDPTSPLRSKLTSSPFLSALASGVSQLVLLVLASELGLRASFVFGHSLGDVVALFAAGKIRSLARVLRVLVVEAIEYHLASDQRRMMACMLSAPPADGTSVWSRVQAFLEAAHAEDKEAQGPALFELVSNNSPINCTVAVPLASVPHLQAWLAQAQPKANYAAGEVVVKLIDFPRACHSVEYESSAEAIKARLLAALEAVDESESGSSSEGDGGDLADGALERFAQQVRPEYLSSSHGRVWAASIDDEFLFHSLRQPVQFERTVQALASGRASSSAPVLIELDGNGTLIPLVRDALSATSLNNALILPTLRASKNDFNSLTALLQCLYQEPGCALDIHWDALYGEPSRMVVGLPDYHLCPKGRSTKSSLSKTAQAHRAAEAPSDNPLLRKVTPLAGPQPFAVVGMACRLPGGIESASDFWQVLCASQCTVTPRLNALPGVAAPKLGLLTRGRHEFDHEFFRLSAKEAALMDDQQRMLLELCYEGLIDAGLTASSLRGKDVGLFIGMGGHNQMDANAAFDLKKAHKTISPTTAIHLYTGQEKALTAGRIAHFFDWRGPSVVVDSACSSSALAVHVAVRSLLLGECSIAFVCGSNLIDGSLDQLTHGLVKVGIHSRTGHSCPFNEQADGYVRAEGCSLVVLRRQAEAERAADRIYATLLHTQTNHNGHTADSMQRPSAAGWASLIHAALESSKIDPRAVHYIEAHSTSSKMADPYEVQAFHQVFGASVRAPEDPSLALTAGSQSVSARSGPLRIGSVKASIGHSEWGSGLTSLVKLCLMLHHNTYVPSLNFDKWSPGISSEIRDTLAMQLQLEPANSAYSKGMPMVAALNSSGMGGANVFLLLRQHIPPVPPSGEPKVPSCFPLCLSGQTTVALQRQCAEWAAWLQAHASVLTTANLVTITRSASLRRDQLKWRCLLAVDPAPKRMTVVDFLVQQLQSAQSFIDRRIGGETEVYHLAGVFLTGDGAPVEDSHKSSLPFRRLASSFVNGSIEAAAVFASLSASVDQGVEQPTHLSPPGHAWARFQAFAPWPSMILPSPTHPFAMTSPFARTFAPLLSNTQHTRSPTATPATSLSRLVGARPPPPISVIGLSLRLPGGLMNADDMWSALLGDKSCLSSRFEDRRPGVESASLGLLRAEQKQFDHAFFHLSLKEASLTDGLQQNTYTCVYEAILDAGFSMQQLRGSPTGLFVAAGSLNQPDRWASLGLPESFSSLSPMSALYAFGGSEKAILANRISHFFDWRGPSYAVDGACASASMAIHEACCSLLQGECTVAVVAAANGIDCNLDYFHSAMTRAGMHSKSGRSAPFDESADGYVRSEGFGVVVLTLASATRLLGARAYADIVATGSNNNGHSSSYMSRPSVAGMSSLVTSVLARAQVKVDQVQYVEAHATSTQVGDPIEAEALATALGSSSRALRVGSVKGHLGHLEWASGVVSLIKVCLMLQRRQFLPTLHFAHWNHQVPPATRQALAVQTKLEPFPQATHDFVAGVNSSGMGGANVFVLLKPHAPEVPLSPSTSDSLAIPTRSLFCLSATSVIGLQGLARSFQQLFSRSDLEAWNPAQLYTLIRALTLRRDQFKHRAAVIVVQRANMRDTLAGLLKQLVALEEYLKHRLADEQSVGGPSARDTPDALMLKQNENMGGAFFVASKARSVQALAAEKATLHLREKRTADLLRDFEVSVAGTQTTPLQVAWEFATNQETPLLDRHDKLLVFPAYRRAVDRVVSVFARVRGRSFDLAKQGHTKETHTLLLLALVLFLRDIHLTPALCSIRASAGALTSNTLAAMFAARGLSLVSTLRILAASQTSEGIHAAIAKCRLRTLAAQLVRVAESTISVFPLGSSLQPKELVSLLLNEPGERQDQPPVLETQLRFSVEAGLFSSAHSAAPGTSEWLQVVASTWAHASSVTADSGASVRLAACFSPALTSTSETFPPMPTECVALPTYSWDARPIGHLPSVLHSGRKPCVVPPVLTRVTPSAATGQSPVAINSTAIKSTASQQPVVTKDAASTMVADPRNELFPKIAALVGVPTSAFVPAEDLEAYGVDSLMSMELVEWINASLLCCSPEQGITTSQVHEWKTAERLANELRNIMQQRGAGAQRMDHTYEKKQITPAIIQPQVAPVISKPLVSCTPQMPDPRPDLFRKAAALVGVPEATFSPHEDLEAYGVDSLMSMELVEWINTVLLRGLDSKLTVTASQIHEWRTAERVAAEVQRLLQLQQPQQQQQVTGAKPTIIRQATITVKPSAVPSAAVAVFDPRNELFRKIASLVGVAEATFVPSEDLEAYGVDSLMSMELVEWVNTSLLRSVGGKHAITSSQVHEWRTAERLASEVYAILLAQTSTSQQFKTVPSVPPQAEMPRAVSQPMHSVIFTPAQAVPMSATTDPRKMLFRKIAMLVGVAEATFVPTEDLEAYGVDSLMSMELVEWINTWLLHGDGITTSQVHELKTAERLATEVHRLLQQKNHAPQHQYQHQLLLPQPQQQRSPLHSRTNSHESKHSRTNSNGERQRPRAASGTSPSLGPTRILSQSASSSFGQSPSASLFNLTRSPSQSPVVRPINVPAITTQSRRPSESQSSVRVGLITRVCAMLELEASRFDAEDDLERYGLDSLMAMELVEWINTALLQSAEPDQTIAARQLHEWKTTNRIAQEIDQRKAGKSLSRAGSFNSLAAATPPRVPINPMRRPSVSISAMRSIPGSPSTGAQSAWSMLSPQSPIRRPLAGPEPHSAQGRSPMSPQAAYGWTNVNSAEPLTAPLLAPEARPTRSVDELIVSSEHESAVCRITLNRASARNTLTVSLLQRMLSAIKAAQSQILVIDNDGDDSFCEGMDLPPRMGTSTRSPSDTCSDSTRTFLQHLLPHRFELISALLTAITSRMLPTVVCVAGSARAGGMGLVCAADVVYCTRASSFSFPEVALGGLPAAVSTVAERRLSKAQARSLMLTGDVVQSGDGLSMGLVDAVHESRSEMERATRRLLARWTGPNTQGGVLAVAKKWMPASCEEDALIALGELGAGPLKLPPPITISTPTAAAPASDKTKRFVRVETLSSAPADAGVLVLTMDHPTDFNGMSAALSADFGAALDAIVEAVTRGEGRVVILRGEGAHFCTGFSMSAAAALLRSVKGAANVAEATTELYRMYSHFARLSTLSIPVIGCVSGRVVGGGLALALHLDYRFGTPATVFEVGVLARGLCPGMHMSVRLARIIGEHRAKDLVLNNSSLQGNEALDAGILHELCADNATMFATACTRARAIAASSPQSVRSALGLLKISTTADPTVLHREVVEMVRCMQAGGSIPTNAAEMRAMKKARVTPVVPIIVETRLPSGSISTAALSAPVVSDKYLGSQSAGCTPLALDRSVAPSPTPGLGSLSSINSSIGQPAGAARRVGICAVSFAFPQFSVPMSAVEAARSTSSSNLAGKYTRPSGLGQETIGFSGDNEDAVSLALTAVQQLMQQVTLTKQQRREAAAAGGASHLHLEHLPELGWGSIGRIDVGTESQVDYSKSIKMHLMELFGTEHGSIEGADSISACYGGTAALFNACAWVESSAWDGRYAIVVAVDQAVMTHHFSHLTGGACVAMLIGPDAPLVLDPARSTYSQHTWDFYKAAGGHCTEPVLEGALSIRCYRDALLQCASQYRARTGVQSVLNHADSVILHCTSILVAKKGLSTLFDEEKARGLHSEKGEDAETVWQRKSELSSSGVRLTGSNFAASVYVSLATLLSADGWQQRQMQQAQPGGRIMIYSYGSGYTASLYTLSPNRQAAHSGLVPVIGGSVVQHLSSTRCVTDAAFFDATIVNFKEHTKKLDFTPLCQYRQGTRFFLDHVEAGRRHYKLHVSEASPGVRKRSIGAASRAAAPLPPAQPQPQVKAHATFQQFSPPQSSLRSPMIAPQQPPQALLASFTSNPPFRPRGMSDSASIAATRWTLPVSLAPSSAAASPVFPARGRGPSVPGTPLSLAANATSGPVQATIDLLPTLRQLLGLQSGTGELDPHTDLTEYGLDSLMTAELVQLIRERWRCEVTTAQVIGLKTAHRIAQQIAAASSK